MISKALGETNYSTLTHTHTYILFLIPQYQNERITFIDVNSEVIFWWFWEGLWISGPLLQNDKVTLCYCSSLLGLIVSLSCSSSTFLINSKLVFFLPSCYSNMSILQEKSSFNTDLINPQREQQKGRTIFPAESDSLQLFSSLLTLRSHDWNTEYGSLHSHSFVHLFLRQFFKPKRWTRSAAGVFCCWGDTITEIERFTAPHCIMSIDN